jgi:uncharacterized NAD(P)/FAD-binding protein YdhS
MRTIAIVGAGFCGTMAAVHLARAGPRGLARVLLIERNGRRVGGVAYGTSSSSHTLNVPAGRMSAFDDDPDHFLRHLRRREPALTGGSFVPRAAYGAYLDATLREARERSSVPVLHVAGEAVDVRASDRGMTVALGDGRLVEAERVLLAVGNYPPADLRAVGPIAASIRYVRDPWAPDALELDRREPVLLLGTGLTACDLALALRDADHVGAIHAVSRRGLLPQPHRASPQPPPHLDPPPTLADWPPTALGLLRALRREVREGEGRGADWRDVLTSIRHDTQELWQRLDLDERRRFLAHLRPYWETHRHRSSPETALAIDTMIADGAMEITAGTVDACREDAGGIDVAVRRRGGGLVTLRVGKVINCTGSDTDLERVGDPLVAALRRAGTIRPDPLGLGVDTDADGRVIAASGRPSGRLFLAGPLRKGRLWEHTAVPELRVEARRLAGLLGGA